MKALQKIVLGLGLLVGSVYAQDVSNTIHSPGYIKDYSVFIKYSENLKPGTNNIYVNFKHKSHTHNDLNTKLTVYSPNNTQIDYKGINTDKNGKYVFNVNLSEKGTYKYVLVFSHETGVSHSKRGSFDLN